MPFEPSNQLEAPMFGADSWSSACTLFSASQVRVRVRSIETKTRNRMSGIICKHASVFAVSMSQTCRRNRMHKVPANHTTLSTVAHRYSDFGAPAIVSRLKRNRCSKTIAESLGCLCYCHQSSLTTRCRYTKKMKSAQGFRIPGLFVLVFVFVIAFANFFTKQWK